MKTYVGIFTVRLETPWVRSLKEKRAIVRPVMERVKARFPVSAARLDGLNEHAWEKVGFSVIGNDAEWVSGVLQTIEDYLLAAGEYRLVVCEREVFVFEGQS